MADDAFGISQTSRRVFGVVIGLVVDNKDPQGQGRVKVRLPGVTSEEIGHWARIATLMAGQERGMLFLPEVNDEVLIAFEQGDVMRPYVLGALWNGKDKPPDANQDGKNNLRIIKSRSGHTIRLDDTEGAEKIEIFDKSQKNLLTFDTAQNTITIQSEQDIRIKAKGAIKLEGQSVEITAQQELKATGQGLTLQARGQAVLKGATVDIN